MPCMSDGYEPSNRDRIQQNIDEQRREQANRDIADKLTQDLCYLCGTLTEKGLLNDVASPRIQGWWKKHQQDDNLRVKRNLRDILNHYYHDHNDIMSVESLASGAIDTAEETHPVSDFHKKWFMSIAEQVWSAWTQDKEEELRQEAFRQAGQMEKVKRQRDEFSAKKSK